MKNLLLGLFTGLLLYTGWPTSPFTYLLFVAFVPLLFAIKNISKSDHSKKGARILFMAWATFALFNVTGTWWVKNAHWSGTVATTIINGFLMALPFWAYYKASSALGEKRARFGLPFLWLCVEVLHQDWDVSFPWLDLGNGLATHIEWIQWYEYTGHMGGTLWIWLVNLAVFRTLSIVQDKVSIKKILLLGSWRMFIWFFIPIIVSQIMYMGYQEKGKPVNVVVVQPNIDSNTEKFSIPEEKQLDKFMRIAQPYLHDSVDYLVGPETQLTDGINETNALRSEGIRYLKSAISQYPNLNFITGAVTFMPLSPQNRTPISRKFSNSDFWYELYNSSFQLNAKEDLHFYHKSKRVVAAEMMPFMDVLAPLIGDVVLDLGGMSSSHGTQETRDVFVSSNGEFRVGTVICWEAEFGQFTTEYAQEGANLLFAITNDGWWGDTDGHRQHMNYARMRAVENRRAIARSANTGISCFINQRGDVLQQLGWAKEGALIETLQANEELTFYTKYGDVIGRVALFISLFLLLFTFARGRIKKSKLEM